MTSQSAECLVGQLTQVSGCDAADAQVVQHSVQR